MNISILKRDWVKRDDLAESFYNRYSRRPVVHIKDIIIEIKKSDGTVHSSASYGYTARLKFPAESLEYHLSEYYDVQVRIDEEGNVELYESGTRMLSMDDRRFPAGSKFSDLEISVLDSIARYYAAKQKLS